jgi:tetratricopeptide (TPR) repeat protein/tRNA A-37 threonylcarbamoyl transferase component Bud32
MEPPAGQHTNPPTVTKAMPPIPAPVSADIPLPRPAPASTARGDRPGSRYRSLRPLGKGGLGEVFVALDEELNREVALKEIQEKHRGSGDSVVRFLLEAEVTGRLEHPGVVPVYGLGRYPDGRPYYAMRLIKGETLKEAIERFHKADTPGRDPGERSLAFRELLRRFVDVCNAVAYAHSKGVLHRDLKPANVMLGPFGETLVIDWGLAKVLGRPTADWTEGVSLLQSTQATLANATGLAGTPGYMSPEQADGGLAELTPASDVYSLGVILYELLAGHGPFKGAALGETLSRQRRGAFTPPRRVKASVPAALEAVCLKAMALQPEDRYGSAKDLAADVDHWLGDEPVTAYPEPLTARLRRWGRRHRATVGGLAALLVSLTAALAVGLALVRAEEGRTRAALGRAEKAEGDLRIELAHVNAGAARLAAHRGQWAEALTHYQKAIDLGHEDDVALWLGVLECRRALYQFRAFREDLGRLEERNDLGAHRGEVRLMRAVAELAGSAEKTDPTKTIWAAIHLGLPPADDAYARGLVAPDMPEAITRLHESLRHDPYHRRSLEALASLLFYTGRVAELRETVTRLEIAAPDAVCAITWRAALLALDGDVDGAVRLCTRLRPLIGDEGVTLVRDSVLIIATLTEANLWESDPRARQELMAKIDTLGPRVGKVMEAPEVMNGLGELATFRLPCYRVFAKHTEIFRDLIKGGNPDPKKAVEVFAATVESCPSGLYFYVYGMFLSKSGRHTEACTAMRQALTAPSVLPVARKARYELAIMLANRAVDASVLARWALQNEAQDHLRALARDGVYPAIIYDNLSTAALYVHDDALALSLCEAWRQRYPDDANALDCRARAEAALRADRRQIETLNTLLEKTPGDVDLLKRRTIAEYRQGFFQNATASCFEALRLDPKEPTALDNLASIERELLRRLPIYAVLREKLRMRAALILAHTGKHAEAVKAVAAERAEGDTAPALACVYAVASSAASKDEQLTADERGKRAEEYAVKAVDLLRRGQQAGYFKDANRTKYLDSEHDFDGLRMRDDFKKLVEAMQK